MKVNNIQNTQYFGSIVRVNSGVSHTPYGSSLSNSGTQELYSLLKADQKNNVETLDRSFRIDFKKQTTTHFPTLLLIDDKYGKDASTLQKIETRLKNGPKEKFGENELYEAIRAASMNVIQRESLYTEDSAKVIVLTRKDLEKVAKLGFEKVLEMVRKRKHLK